MGRIPRIEILEPRRLLSVSLNAQTGLLTVNGTAVGDVVSITQSSTTLTVVDAGASHNFTASQVKSIQVTLGSGADKVTIANAVIAAATVTAGAGNDTLIAGGGSTTLIAGSGNDLLQAGSAADLLMGGPGSDTYTFGVVSVTPASPPGQITYTISPGKGKSTLDFSTMPASAGQVNVDLTSDAALAAFAGRTVQTALAGQAGLFTVVLGGGGNDDFVANAANDSLVGGSGNNTLVAGSGNDTLVGNGTANDYIFKPQSTLANYIVSQPKAGQNTLDFSALTPADPLVVNLNFDYMADYDNVTIHDAATGQFKNFSEILDGAGDDIITANNAGDLIQGGSGADTITGGTGADLFLLGSGFNVVSGEGGADIVRGTTGNYVIYAIDYLSDPRLQSPVKQPANESPIEVSAGSGSSSIVGGSGNDTLEGSGDDTIHGMGGDDNIQGGDGPSVLFGDAGNDIILARMGDTTIVGGTGQDTVTGGGAGGFDNFIDKDIPDNSTTAAGGAVIDSISLTANAIAADQGLAAPTYPLVGTPGIGDLITGESANMTVIGGLGDDTISGGNGPATIVGGSGTNVLSAGNGADVVQGGAGADTIIAGFGPDVLTGGSGNTTFENVNGYPDTVIGGSGFSSATVDPTGTSVFNNIQLFYQPSFPSGPIGVPVLPVFPSSVVVVPAAPLPPPSLLKGVLTAGSKTYTGQEVITVSQSPAAGTVSVLESGIGFFVYAAASVSRVVVNGGPGGSSFDLSTLLVPATVSTGNGANNFVAGGENDTIAGGNGSDTLLGGPGHNVISGGAGTNLMFGGSGNDSITGGSGFDYIFTGGDGITIPNDPESDTITAGNGTETLYMSCNADPLDVRLDKKTVTDLASGAKTHINGTVKNFYAGAGNATMVSSAAKQVYLIGGAGNDTIFGTAAGDYLNGGTGSSFLYADSVMEKLDFAAEASTSIGHYVLGNASNVVNANARDVQLFVLQHPPA